MKKTFDTIFNILGIILAITCVGIMVYMLLTIHNTSVRYNQRIDSIPYKIIYRDTCTVKPIIKDSL